MIESSGITIIDEPRQLRAVYQMKPGDEDNMGPVIQALTDALLSYAYEKRISLGTIEEEPIARPTGPITLAVYASTGG